MHRFLVMLASAVLTAVVVSGSSFSWQLGYCQAGTLYLQTATHLTFSLTSNIGVSTIVVNGTNAQILSNWVTSGCSGQVNFFHEGVACYNSTTCTTPGVEVIEPGTTLFVINSYSLQTAAAQITYTIAEDRTSSAAAEHHEGWMQARK